MPDRSAVTPAIDPVDESDAFCTCPTCLTLGTHAVETRRLADGWHAHRTCWSCEHVWYTPADEPPGPVDIHDPLGACPGCGVCESHPLEVVTLNNGAPVTTFLGQPLGGWSISGPDGTEVAIHQCRDDQCKRMWHTEDE